MPTYEYRCEQGHHFEAVQSMSDDHLDACLTCGAPAVRILHPPAGRTSDMQWSGYAGNLKEGSDSKRAPADPEKSAGTKSWLDTYAQDREPPSRRKHGRKS
ncbi:MAG: zinc ribbon domain-containing protein [Actinomycetota bacterium]|nr:zinc ribbon domain-containing protein [Actinomycetota bacterium]